MPKFNKAPRREAPVGAQSPTGALTQPEPEEVFIKAVRCFISTLVTVCSGEDSITEAAAKYAEPCAEIAALSEDDRAALQQQLSVFIGRLGTHVEPLYREWNQASRAALTK